MNGHPPSHLDIETPLFYENDGFTVKKPHLWIQWKGTNVCCDIHCACGAHLHFDGDFLYFFQCPHCKRYWECGTHMPIYEVTEERAGKYVKHPEPDDDSLPDHACIPLAIGDANCYLCGEPMARVSEGRGT